jgi:5'-AMP-activated protein kinase catalytic alpha subunit
VVNRGFDREQLIASLRSRVQNEVWSIHFHLTYYLLARLFLITINLFQGTVTYYLLLDNRYRVSTGYLGAEFQETMVGLFSLQLLTMSLVVCLRWSDSVI